MNSAVAIGTVAALAALVAYLLAPRKVRSRGDGGNGDGGSGIIAGGSAPQDAGCASDGGDGGGDGGGCD